MSGIEVAGLVLAAFPLAISALEHYRDAAKTLGTFWKIRKEYRAWIHNLNICKLAFEQNLEELLLPLITDDDELHRLIAAPGSPEWSKPELEIRLRDRLTKSYALYSETIDRVRGVMDELNGELGLEKTGFQKKINADGATSHDDLPKPFASGFLNKANLEFQALRIKMSLNRSKRDELFKELMDANSELRTLLDTSDRIAVLQRNRSSRKSRARLKNLFQFWRHASNLYDLLAQSWRCGCKVLHRANILLEHRMPATVEFIIWFVYASRNAKQRPGLWACQRAEAKLLDDDWAPKEAKVRFGPVPTTSAVPITKTQSVAVSGNLRTGKPDRGNSMFGKFEGDCQRSSKNRSSSSSIQPLDHAQQIISALPSITSTLIPDVILPRTSKSTRDEADMAETFDLCETFATFHCNKKHQSCLKNDQCRFSLRPLESREIAADMDDMISLELLLSRGSGIILRRRQRYSIALTLASSYLQLYSTPWINFQWSKRDILFPKDTTNANKVYLDQPYISRDFIPPDVSSNSPSDRSLKSLGIMLLELCFGTAIEDHELRPNYPHNEALAPLIDIAVALEWSPQAVEEAGPEFADAILWCLHNGTNNGESNCMSEKWREQLFLNVVQPLEYCHGQLASVAKY